MEIPGLFQGIDWREGKTLERRALRADSTRARGGVGKKIAVRARGRRGESAYYLPLAPNGKGIKSILSSENAHGGPDIPELAKKVYFCAPAENCGIFL